HDYTFELDMPPRFVLPNPDFTVMAEFRVDQPASAWVAQLRYALEPASRVLAARALRAFTSDPALLVGLKNAFDVERHHAVRREIVGTMRFLPNDSAKERALLDASRDDHAAVRENAVAALSDLGGSQSVADRLFELAQNDPSYRVQSQAVVALARIGAPTAVDVFRSALITPSFREYVRRAAFQALTYLELPANEEYRIANEHSRPGQPTEVRSAAIRHLGVLAADQRRALDRLIALANDATYDVRRAVIAALETVEDPRAVEALEARLTEEPEPKLRELLRETVQKWHVTFAE
ncbi:MAG TPA: HEAT repeat domain-containing protein, partial [Rhodothermales bacterium]